MKKIDDIFKNGLDNKGLAYTEAHWESMAALLDAKKVSFFARNKWMFGILGLLLTSCTIALFLVKSPNQDPSNTSNNTQDSKSMISEVVENDLIKKEPKRSSNSEGIVAENDINSLPEIITLPHINKESPITELEIQTSRTNNRITFETNLEPKTEVSQVLKIEQSIESEIPNIEAVHTLSKLDFNWLESRTISSLYAHSSSALSKSEFEQSNKRKMFSMYISPYLVGNKYSRTTDALADYDAKSFEQPINSIGYGLNIMLKRGNWVLKTGAEIMSLREQTNYVSTVNTYSYDTALHLVNGQYAFTPRGTKVALVEERVDSFKTGTQDLVECVDCVTKFNYITIPLSIQFEIQKHRMIYFGEVGMSASYLQRAQGNYSFINIKDSVEQIVIEDVSGNSNLTNMLLFGQASLGLKYRITSSLNAYASYGYSRGLNSMISGYKQTPSLNQIKFGFEFKLK